MWYRAFSYCIFIHSVEFSALDKVSCSIHDMVDVDGVDCFVYRTDVCFSCEIHRLLQKGNINVMNYSFTFFLITEVSYIFSRLSPPAVKRLIETSEPRYSTVFSLFGAFCL